MFHLIVYKVDKKDKSDWTYRALKAQCDLSLLDMFSFHMHLYYKQNKTENACATRAQKSTGHGR